MTQTQVVLGDAQVAQVAISNSSSPSQIILSAPVIQGGGGSNNYSALSMPSGFTVSGSTTPSIVVTYASGFALPTTARQAQWDTAYAERLYWDGGASGLVPASGRASLALGSGDSPTFSGLTITGEAAVAIPHIHGDLAGSVYIHVKNTSASTLPKGTPVYVTGTVGDTATLEVQAADSSDPAKMPAIGLLAGSIAPNGTGHASVAGELAALNTAAYSINSPLYVASGGGLTSTEPVSGTIQQVAIVGRVQSGTGSLTVTIASLQSPTWDVAYAERLYWNGSPSGLNAASGRTSLGLATVASTGAYADLSGVPSIPSGTVRSVALSLPDVFVVSGSPVTNSGVISASFSGQPSGTVLAAPAGASGAPSFRRLGYAELSGLPTLASGTVQSVALSLPGVFVVSGSPVTASGTISATFANQASGVVLAGPVSGSGIPAFRQLGYAELSGLPSAPSYATLGPISDGLVFVLSNRGETAIAGTNYAEAPVPVASGTTFTLTAVRFGSHIDTVGASTTTFNAYRRTPSGVKTSVLSGNATLASGVSLVDATSSLIASPILNAGDRIGVDVIGVGTNAQGLFAQFVFSRSPV
jgi:hypothetical protein